MSKVLLLGASPNPSRYAWLAAERLQQAGHEVIPLGIRPGKIAGLPIHTERPKVEDLHTVTLYLHPRHQKEYEDWLLELKPRRIIFNPGAENPSLARRARENGIETLEACTLVMLASGTF